MENNGLFIPVSSNGQKDEKNISFLAMTGINIDERYRKNLKRIIDKYFGGNQSAFARKVGFEPSYINGILHESRTLGKTNVEVICDKLGLDLIEFMLPENPRYILDDDEFGAVSRIRKFKQLGMDDMVKEAEAGWIEAAEKRKKKTPAKSTEKDLRESVERMKRSQIGQEAARRRKKKEST